MLYEIWETGSRNRVGAFASLEAALTLVRRSVEKHGASYADTLALAREDEEGDTEVLAEGAELVKMARPVFAL
jgi:hypothetical protein